MQTNYEIDFEQLPNQQKCNKEDAFNPSHSVEHGNHVGMYVPNLALIDFEEDEYKLYDLMDGKDLFVLQFGVEWCDDCKRDHEKLTSYYSDLPQEIGFALIYVDYSKLENRAIFENAKIDSKLHPWRSFYDYDNVLAKEFHVVNMPTTVVIQNDGKIKAITIEMDTDRLLLPNTDELIYPVPTQESYGVANNE